MVYKPISGSQGNTGQLQWNILNSSWPGTRVPSLGRSPASLASSARLRTVVSLPGCPDTSSYLTERQSCGILFPLCRKIVGYVNDNVCALRESVRKRTRVMDGTYIVNYRRSIRTSWSRGRTSRETRLSRRNNVTHITYKCELLYSNVIVWQNFGYRTNRYDGILR